MSQVLHPIEQKIIQLLAKQNKLSHNQISEKTGLSIDQVRRGVEWLRHKEIVEIKSQTSITISLGKAGIDAKRNGLPERKLVQYLSEKNTNELSLDDVKNSFDKNEFNVALANAKKNGWITISKDSTGKRIIQLAADNKTISSKTPEEKLLDELYQNQPIPVDSVPEIKDALEFLETRPDYVKTKSTTKDAKVFLTEYGLKLSRDGSLFETEQGGKTKTTRKLTAEIIGSGKWKETNIAPIDVEAKAPEIHVAKRHPLNDLIEEIREAFVSLGFSEITGDMIQSSFWNFDALFTPQDHPAREMQDTFYLDDTTGTKATINATKNQIDRVKQEHKRGWKYEWKKEHAKKRVLRTHTTCLTIKHLADNKPDEARIFSVGRVFRNEKVSYKHLVEFNQIEGVVSDKNATLRDLMGLQKEFYHKMGIKKIKFWPTFFPYTEPSLQSMVYNEKHGKWVELFGMGIFRPEVTKPFGIKNRVLAWGGGIERIAMLRLGLDDVRELYNNNLGWLRRVPKCQ